MSAKGEVGNNLFPSFYPFSLLVSLWGQSPWGTGCCISLAASRSDSTGKKKNDTDYERFIGGINTPFFSPSQQLFISSSAVRRSDWWQDSWFSLSTAQAVYALFPIPDADLPLQFRRLWQPHCCHQGETHHRCHGCLLWGKVSRLAVYTCQQDQRIQ